MNLGDFIIIFQILGIAVIQFLTFKYLVKINMFLISFQPLFIILVIKFTIEKAELMSSKNMLEYITCLYISFQSLLNNLAFRTLLYLAIMPIFILILRNKTSSANKKYNAKGYKLVSEDIVSYVMTYIVPLTTLTVQSKSSDAIGNIILFLIIMILYIRLDLTYLNPVLILLGYNIYKINIVQMDGKKYERDGNNDNDVMKYIITRKKTDELDELFKNDSKHKFEVHSLGGDLLMEC